MLRRTWILLVALGFMVMLAAPAVANPICLPHWPQC